MLLMFIALTMHILMVMVFFMPMLLMFITILMVMHHMLIHMIMLMLMMLRAATLTLSLILLSLSLSLSVRVVLLHGRRHKRFPLRSSHHVFLLQLTKLYYARHALHVAHHTSLSHVFFQHL